ncbi:MAG: hypothetical protein ABR499_05290 [Gemmatimonadaceae bacterium]
MRRRIVIVAALLAIASASEAQDAAPDAVVRLGPDAFPALPGPIRAALSQRGCMIPQSYGERKPHNVITGAFTGPQRREWAVVCSAHDTSTILIFSGTGRLVDVTDKRAEDDWITHMPEGRVYTQRLERVPLAELRKIRPDPEEPGLGLPPTVDHDAIMQVMDGKGSSTLYKTGGRWRQVDACC